MTSSEDACLACTWSAERQNHCAYKSHVKIFYEASDRGVWSLGSKLILKDRGPNHPTNEIPNVQFVKEQTSINVPTILEYWEEDDGHALTLMTRIPGETLNEAWPKLSAAERENIAKQTAECLLELRKLQSDKMQSLSGGPIGDNFLFHGDGNWPPRGPLASDDDLWREMESGLPPSVSEPVRARLRNTMPPATPYTFTHGDLTDINIMVENGSLSGIIDWERAGYFPVWWEYVDTSVRNSEDDAAWKELLRKYMPDYSAAREFWRVYYWLGRDPEHEVAKKFIEETAQENV